MRRPGGPILEFAESGSGCDWADICWKPGDSTTLIIGSQLALTPGIQKWDLRYPTAPMNEFHMHDRGVTAIDWHRKDPRIVVSAGNDGYVRVFNPETGENDKVRAISWSEVHPELLAIQFFQHSTEFRSIETGGEHLPLTIVPAWVSAAPVGASFALGGRMATHYRHWDDARQIWCYGIDIKKLPVDEVVHQTAIELQNALDSNSFGSYCEDRAHETRDRDLQILWTLLAAVSSRQSRREYIRILGFGGEESIPKETIVSPTSTTSNEVTQLTNIMSSLNYTSPGQDSLAGPSVSDEDDSSHDDVFLRQADLDFNELGCFLAVTFIDENTWSLFDALINEGDQVVIDRLLEEKDYATAFMLARGHSGFLRRVTEKYIAEELPAPQRLFSLISTSSFDQLIETFPREKWSRLLALVLTRTDHVNMMHYMKKLAVKWMADKGSNTLHAAFAAILAQDMKLFLRANYSCSLDERIKQGIVLRAITGIDVDEEYEMLLYKYCEKLINSGVSDFAWRLLSNFNTKNELLLSIRHDLFFICGGEDRTMIKQPANPRLARIQNVAGVFPSSASLQQGSAYQKCESVLFVYNQALQATKPPTAPRIPSTPNISGTLYGGVLTSSNTNIFRLATGPPQYVYQQTPNVTVFSSWPTVPGFNPVSSPISPPPVMEVHSMLSSNNYATVHPTSYTNLHSGVIQKGSNSVVNSPLPSILSNVVHCNDVQSATLGWNDPPSLPGRKPKNLAKEVIEVTWKPLEPTPVGVINDTTKPVGGVSQHTPFLSPSSDQSHQEIIQPSLTPEDKAIVERFYQVIDSVVAANHAPATLHKAGEAKTRIDRELAPRLAAGKLSSATRQLLLQCCELSSRGDYRGAGATCRQMVQAGGDFVEVGHGFLMLFKYVAQICFSFYILGFRFQHLFLH
ncbi:WD domain, G-beta repeat protein [Dictyocaulus viviparus]|uniref:WD domain, G-beta repeat protein n=1 Tax=Dictyocaulus viviparus TaxID=29172 RepID=A0A0D8XV14_DICVI|nr:WD domain, G-beta repeat protein [Dictyocaulus viviparus]